MGRPSETAQAVVSSIVGAAIGIVIIYFPEAAENLGKAAPYIVILLAWVATFVTWLVSRRLRDPNSALVSREDGSVTMQSEPVTIHPLPAPGSDE